MCPRRRPWDRFGRWGLGRQDVNAPQQAKGQLNSEKAAGDSFRIGVGDMRGLLVGMCGRCLRGFRFIAIQIKGLESTGSLPSKHAVGEHASKE